jgi:hypothetical protein
MVGRLVFSAVAISIGAILHRSLNENVVGSFYVLLAGVGFGFLLLALAAAAIYAAKGTLKPFLDYSVKSDGWREQTAWYPLACLVVLCGIGGVSVWNQTTELRPQKVEEWKVVHKGKRPASLLHLPAKFSRTRSSDKVLILERGGEELVYSYSPYFEKDTDALPLGSTIRVRLRMGPLGLFRIDRLEY